MSTIFEKIILGQIPSEKVFENERILVIKDKYPIAPVHLLILPKKKITSLQEMQKEDLPLVSEMALVAQMLAEEFQISDGYRLLTNIGKNGGQSILHLHFHLIGGRRLGVMG